MSRARYHLLDAHGRTVESTLPGTLGGNRRLRIYGRLDCASAIRALPLGYAARRVFFADESTAIAAGYRPCGICMRQEYARWKAARQRAGDTPTRG
jgi:methylphosphotriester-DNA--protein-cysteine methyltransferase